MKTLYFDCFSGISGDMAIGALLDLGISREAFLEELSKLNLTGYKIEIVRKTQHGISGTDINVILEEENRNSSGELENGCSHTVQDRTDYTHSHDHPHDHTGQEHDHPHNPHDSHNHGGILHGNCEHGHEHSEEHTHLHEHSHDDHSHDHSHGHSHSGMERNLGDIELLLDQSSLSDKIKSFSKRVFREIAAAEAKVHGKPIYEVHFHEVGAIDSIVDIAGTAICLELLGVEKVCSSVIHDGNGFIQCRHGIIPVPVPAVMEMLSGSGIPLVSEDVGTELVTPTGMGLIKCLAAEYGCMPPMVIEKSGYGLGKRDTGRLNALRVILGETAEASGNPPAAGINRIAAEDQKASDGMESSAGEIVILETNIDDTTGEVLGYAMSKLLEAGALDVFYTPIFMKKGRPAYMLSVLLKPGMEDELTEILLSETSTIGVRMYSSKRCCMDRRIVQVKTPFGSAGVKIAERGGIVKASPEFEDCRRIAESTGLPLMQVYKLLQEEAGKQHGI